LGIIGFQPEGLLELEDGVVKLAFLAEGGAQVEVVMGVGVIRL
jgi:hypothetical protein